MLAVQRGDSKETRTVPFNVINIIIIITIINSWSPVENEYAWTQFYKNCAENDLKRNFYSNIYRGFILEKNMKTRPPPS